MKISDLPAPIRLLFDKDHVVRAIWTLIIGLIIFFLGMWANSIRQPAKVEVVNSASSKDTMIVSFDTNSLTDAQQIALTIAQLSRDIRDLRRQSARGSTDQSQPLPNQLNVRTPAQIAHGSEPRPIKIDKITLEPSIVAAQLRIPRYEIPSTIKGYSQIGFGTIANVDVRNPTVRRDSLLHVVITLLDPSTLKKLTPFYAEILRKESERSYTLLISQQYDLTAAKNLIQLVADTPPGEYELRLGAFVLDELNTTYPSRYTYVRQITVLE